MYARLPKLKSRTAKRNYPIIYFVAYMWKHHLYTVLCRSFNTVGGF